MTLTSSGRRTASCRIISFHFMALPSNRYSSPTSSTPQMTFRLTTSRKDFNKTITTTSESSLNKQSNDLDNVGFKRHSPSPTAIGETGYRDKQMRYIKTYNAYHAPMEDWVGVLERRAAA